MNTQAGNQITSVATDAALIVSILDGCVDAATSLFRRHASALYAFVLPRTGGDAAAAEDLTQETFIDAWRNLRRFEIGRSFPAWLVGIARRKLARYYRRRFRSRQEGANDILARIEGNSPEPLRRIEEREATLAVTGALAGLSAGTRELLLAKYRDGRSLADLAAELGIRPEAVSSRLQRARAAFKLALTRTGGADAIAG